MSPYLWQTPSLSFNSSVFLYPAVLHSLLFYFTKLCYTIYYTILYYTHTSPETGEQKSDTYIGLAATSFYQRHQNHKTTFHPIWGINSIQFKVYNIQGHVTMISSFLYFCLISKDHHPHAIYISSCQCLRSLVGSGFGQQPCTFLLLSDISRTNYVYRN